MRLTPIVLAMVVSGITALSVATVQKPTFEVASIKPKSVPPPPFQVTGQVFIPSIQVTGGRLFVKNTTLRALAQFAYRQASDSPFAAVYTIVGGPAFIDKDRYDVEAKTENKVPLELARAMMRSLLEERFALAVHTETRELPVYDLAIGKGGVKMKQLPDDAEGYMRPVPGKRATYVYAAPISTFVGLAQAWADRLIIDKTGLTGMFEELQTDDVTNAGAAPGANVAILRFEDNTGLRLIPAREMVEVLVIDHAEKPSEN